MSYDLDYNRICPHFTVREMHSIEPDLRTVYIDMPVASSVTLEVYLNGRQVLPDHPVSGWNIVRDPSKVSPDFKKLVFNRERKALDDFVEISYFTTQWNCRRCHTLGIYDDIQFTVLGKPKTVRNENKLLQDMEKIVVTVLGSNIFHQWYGTSLLTLIGRGERGIGVLVPLMTREVYNALFNLKNLQIQQSSVKGQKVTLQEILDTVDSVIVEQSDVDPTHFEILANVTSMAGDKVSVSKKVIVQGALIVERDLKSGRFIDQVQGQQQTNRLRSQLVGRP